MIDSNLLITAAAVVLGLVWLGAWLLGKIRRGEIEIGTHTILLVLLAAILLVPFAVNVAGHLIANSLYRPSGENGAQHEEAAPAHKHDSP
ncbi:MAG TPA: hypothetical protein VFI43_00345 [Nitrosospira sp.]|nr:hypothetical protein [Nitrosospira sp.]